MSGLVSLTDTQPLHERVVLITGAAGGLGSAAAKACAKAGATVILLGHKVPKLNRLYDALAAVGPEPVIYPLDMAGASPDDYGQMAEQIKATLGRLDGVLHCAAEFRGLTPLEHTAPSMLVTDLHVNLTARWLLSQACLPLLKASADSALVFVLNNLVQVGQAYWGGYGLAQYAGHALVKMLDAELANSSIRVCGLEPGSMRTLLRAKVYVEDEDSAAQDAEVYAQACVELLSPKGSVHRGQVWSVRP